MAMPVIEEGPKGNVLEGKTIVISGVFTHHSRDEYKAMIEQLGGKNTGSISAKTSFVLAGDNMGPSKLQKAESLGVKILSEDEFLEMIKIKRKELLVNEFANSSYFIVVYFSIASSGACNAAPIAVQNSLCLGM